ncbi:hypothetical protein CU669_15210 [Paramagnetospirillum kuznetsovii]|uniref:DUF1367 family protein n=1 Tax=Paramagnetospirillum kuznetsovii TaxID=2053833 RepID=A0A364NVT4_9PROT|nr:DUF1367 family protein [Paramagnetospirillum kuznetsovii]RAU21100.1 hypothetical protein CU669_15210 [Paramagnetospirillum kuznetsovii]
MFALFIKTLGGLRPANQDAAEILSRYKVGDMVTAEVKKPRNLAHHRLYWELCRIVAANMPGDHSAEIVSDVIKIRAGHCAVVATVKGEVFSPKSISFATMDQHQFREFFDRALAVVVNDILPGVDSAALEAEVQSILEGKK